MKLLTAIIFLGLCSVVYGKEAHTQMSVSCTVLPAPAKPVVTQTIENGVTVITVKY